MSPQERRDRALLLARTVEHLSMAQVASRLRLRALKLVLTHRPATFERRWRRSVQSSRWPRSFTAVDQGVAIGQPSPADNAHGTFMFLGESRDLGEPIHWRPADATQLWRYHLHYWEWAWPLLDHPDREWARATLTRLWRSWRQGTTFGRWDEWSPYVVSLRAWVLCNLFGPLAAGTPLADDLLDDIGLHAGFVAANLELDLGGNHLIKNLKAAVGLGVFFGDERLTALGTRHLHRQIPIQVLDDGGHFERSPSYHAQVLGDLIDIRALLTASGRPDIPGLKDAIISMRTWLSTMVLPDGDVPPLNDSTIVGTRRLAALGVQGRSRRRLDVLPDSGYAILRSGSRLHLVVDVGPPCPPELPAHAQADCLTFELCLDGHRFIVDPGTSTYESGSRRAWERSTAAHNTVQVDCVDQTEVWATFRAARLANARLERASDDGSTITVAGSHDGYSRLPGRPRHRRTWEMSPVRLVIRDELTGNGTHGIQARLQLAPGVHVIMADDHTVLAGAARISVAVPVDFRLQVLPAGSTPGGVARRFGGREPAAAVHLAMDATLPVAWTTTIDVEDTTS